MALHGLFSGELTLLSLNAGLGTSNAVAVLL
jgi:hypothetical protein